MSKHLATGGRNYTAWLLSLAAVLLVIVGFLIYGAHVNSYTRGHFNKNVTIYGVSVGGLTKNQARAKVNSRSKNTAFLVDGKIVTRKDKTHEAISQSQVNAFFDQQYHFFPSKKNYVFQSGSLAQVKAKLKSLNKRTVDFLIADKTFKIKASDAFEEVAYSDGRYRFLKKEGLRQKLRQINGEVATFDKSYDFETPADGRVKVKNDTWGWGVYEKKALPAVETAFADGKKSVEGKDYLYGKGYNTYQHGYGLDNHGVGRTYIVVSIRRQAAWFYRDGKQVLHLTDVVTGTQDSSTADATPTGVFYIMYKQSPSTLRGQNDDGSSYASPVKYWMPFTLSGCGFHDASWRTDWSKTAYLQGGSHGCVNVRPSEIKSVWDVVSTNEPVVIYN